LIERPIDEYLRSDPFSLAHALERLRRVSTTKRLNAGKARIGAQHGNTFAHCCTGSIHGGSEMDALLQALRFLAKKPNDPNSVLLGELRIRDYLKGPTASLQRLNAAIDEEVKACHGDKFFWIAIQKFVQSQFDK
jgi:hypothetical protein